MDRSAKRWDVLREWPSGLSNFALSRGSRCYFLRGPRASDAVPDSNPPLSNELVRPYYKALSRSNPGWVSLRPHLPYNEAHITLASVT